MESIFWFYLSLTIGAIFHIIEDGFTVSGVRPFLPKELKISGNVRTFSKSEKRLTTFMLFALLITFIISIDTRDYILATILVIMTFISAFFVSKTKFISK